MRHVFGVTLALGFMALVLGLMSCSSMPEKIALKDNTQNFDKTLNFVTTEPEKIGVRGSDVVFQKRVYLEVQLSRLTMEAEDLQNAVYGASKTEPGGMWQRLKECRARVADARIGGNGTPEPMERWEKVTDREENFKYIVDKHDSVIGVSEEEVDGRITRYIKYKSLLNERYDDFGAKLDSCEAKYSTALINHGLNPNQTKARGAWVDGPDGYKVWKMVTAGTNDPEELAKRK